MSKLLAVLVAIFAAAWFATPAFAGTGTDGLDPYIQICKDASSPLTGPFTFTVGEAPAKYDIGPGSCTTAIDVKGLTTLDEHGHTLVAVNEVAHPWFQVKGVTYRDTKGGLNVVDAADLPVYDSSADNYTVEIPVKAAGTDSPTIIHVTNDPVMGTLEICKYAEEATNATGTFTFAVSSPTMDEGAFRAEGWMDNLPAPANVSVTIGSCSGPISVPAGETIVTELKTNGQLWVTKIDVTPWSRLIAKDREVGTVNVYVPAKIDKLGETKVDFYNSLATLKVCKVAADEDARALAPYPFTATGAAAFSLTPTSSDPVCHEVGQYAPGALVTVTEGVVAGTAVSDISLNQGFVTDPKVTKYPDTLDEGTRTASFYMRAGVDEVTFTNDPAASVPLKVCKLPGTLTGTYSFATSGLTGYVKPFWGIAPDPDKKIAKAPTSFTVIPGQCTWVGYFPYNGTITIAETAGNLTGVVVDPESTTAVILSKDLGARSATVMLGSYDTWAQCRFEDLFPAIIDFTNAPASSGSSGSGSSTTTTTVTSTATTASTSTPTKVAAPAKALKVSTARIVSVGKLRYVVVRVNGAAKTARIHVTLINKNHKVVGSLTRYVATNKAVRVGNLRLSPSVFSVKVSL